jgi:DNA-binding transcriptional MerR regulator
MASPITNLGPDPEIPDKLYFRIGEVSRLANVKPYVLRYWETEFPGLGPKKSGSNHRLYRRKDVELILEIKRLLYERRFTIEGARRFLETRGKAEPKPGPAIVPAAVPAPVAPTSKTRIKSAPPLFAAEMTDPLPAIRAELQSILLLMAD